jgi:hypothetical protein
MGNVEQDRTMNLLELYVQRICPYCGKHIPKGEGTGSGQKADGLFCSLDCYTHFYAAQLVEKHLTKQIDMDKKQD